MPDKQKSIPTTKDIIKVDIPYFQAPNAVFDLEKVKNIHQLSILLYLHRCGNQGGVAFPSYSTMATKCRMSRMQAIRTIKSLVGSELLIKTKSPFKSNVYTLNLPSNSQLPPSNSQLPPSNSQLPYKEPVIKNHDVATTRDNDNGHENLFKIYEGNIGILTPLIAEKLKDIASEYSVEWFEEAVKVACEANIRKLNYITRILERWRVEGFKAPKSQRGARGSGRGQRPDDRKSRYVLVEPHAKGEKAK